MSSRSGRRKAKSANICSRRPESTGSSIYARVTRRIIEDLEHGFIPWARPWNSPTGSAALPANAISGRPYSGINILLLWGAALEKGYASQSWLTFRQALEAGGSVRKGERGTAIVYADRFTPESERNRAEQAGEEPRAVHFLKCFTVFNIAQCDGLPERYFESSPATPEPLIIGEAEDLICRTGADFRVGGDEAFYCPSRDYVQVPRHQQFPEPVDYYRTALHEFGHWTGHPSRLARDHSGRFGSESYAREELVAELSAAFTCAALGIEPALRHAAYIGHWLTILRSDERAIFKAASLASRASDFLLAFRQTASVGEASLHDLEVMAP